MDSTHNLIDPRRVGSEGTPQIYCRLTNNSGRGRHVALFILLSSRTKSHSIQCITRKSNSQDTVERAIMQPAVDTIEQPQIPRQESVLERSYISRTKYREYRID